MFPVRMFFALLKDFFFRIDESAELHESHADSLEKKVCLTMSVFVVTYL